MAQFLRPASTVSVSNLIGGRDSHTLIDEAVASDADSIASVNNTTALALVGLSAATDPGVDTGFVVRYRYAKTNAGTPDSGGSNATLQVTLRHNGVDLVSGTLHTVSSGTWTAGSFNVSGGAASSITDFASLELRFDIVGGSGSPANRRGVGVSWAEMEVPDAVAPPVTGTLTVQGVGTLSASGMVERRSSLAVAAVGSFSAGGIVERRASAAFAAIGSFSVEAVVEREPVTGSASLAGSSALGAAGLVERRSSWSPTGASAFSASGLVERGASVAMVGSSALAVEGTTDRPPVTGAASFVGSSALSAGGTAERLTGAALAGTGGFSASGQVNRQAGANLAATGVLTASARVERITPLSVVGAAGFSVAAAVERGASVSFEGIGEFSVQSGPMDVLGTAALAGASAFSVEPTIERNAAVSLAGAAAFAASSSIERSASLALAGAAAFAADPSLELVGQATFVGASGFLASGTTAPDVPITIRIADRIATLLEPAAVAGQMIEEVFGWHVVIDEAAIGAHVQPYVFRDCVLYVWESADRRSTLSSDGIIRHDFEFTAAIMFDDGGEEARMVGGDRELQAFIDMKQQQYVDAIRHNQQTEEWDYASSVVDPNYPSAFGLRGFALRITGYRLQ